MLQSTFGFRYAEPPVHLMLLKGIGWETIDSEAYSFDGLKRHDQGVLFQLTLSGEGRLRVGGSDYSLSQHHGFLAAIPGNHHYYYDPATAGGKPWEFIWLMASGDDALAHWRRMKRQSGSVLMLKPDSMPLELMWRMYKDVAEHKLRDKYEVSHRLYEWLMAMEEHLEGKIPSASEPVPVSLAKRFMESQYGKFITLEDIAEAAGLSKHHFCRMFQQQTGMTPFYYLRKKRIEEAAKALRQSELPVHTIAMLTGFDNSSYFGKVFRRLVGVSPQQFRDGKVEVPVNALVIE